MKVSTVFFVGKPGCGKGTQAALLSQTAGWPVISAGKQFRALGQEDSVAGRRMKKEIDAGHLAPHWFAMYLYLKALFGLPEGSGAIFDGFNRKVHEAELIVDSLQWLGRSFVVVNIVVSDDEIRRRLEKRKETDGRADDHVVDERLREFREYTENSIDVFRRAGSLIEIDGERTPEEIAADIRAKLELA